MGAKSGARSGVASDLSGGISVGFGWSEKLIRWTSGHRIGFLPAVNTPIGGKPITLCGIATLRRGDPQGTDAVRTLRLAPFGPAALEAPRAGGGRALRPSLQPAVLRPRQPQRRRRL